MRFLPLLSLFLLPAFSAMAQEPEGVTACRVESVNQSGGVITVTGVSNEGCDGASVTSYGQTGGITAANVGSVTIGSDRPLTIEKPPTGSISICRTSRVLEITARRTTLVVRGGRRCSANEEPTVVIDAKTNAIIGGVNRGDLLMHVE